MLTWLDKFRLGSPPIIDALSKRVGFSSIVAKSIVNEFAATGSGRIGSNHDISN